ncbi:hypothetical protein KZJ38_22985 [Paraburkholderia edwinii]|jgi:hypothetical protein|uniref:Uncharacterized protein n=1 Tax=Paraburkholderia edwinii TaxID=2861782 RepID=A0ABX8UZ04_9BURK|nr:hypothetical protein [Paraburkholderia edwinii]QYD72582.1 hypothetical protein KZJ38_22985 [Paraburkholderia edwinii]
MLAIARLRPKYFWIAAYLLLACWSFWPVANVLIANIVARLFDCRLSEGGPLPCHAFGHDISHPLYVLATSFWLALTTVPTGVPLILLLGIVHICITLVRRHRSRGRKERD